MTWTGPVSTQTVTQERVPAHLGELRRGKDGKLYANRPTKWNLAPASQNRTALTVYSGTEGTSVSAVDAAKTLLGLASGQLRYGLPAQPWKQYSCEPAVSVIYAYREVGMRSYECKDHLGNVRAVVSDVRVSVVGSGIVSAFKTEVLSWTDYYAYGYQMPGRHWSAEGYRYGFQGQEKDDEVKGEGLSLNYEYRMHDPRVGRWKSIDPMHEKYPSSSPYSSCGNNPILFIDLAGQSVYVYNQKNELLFIIATSEEDIAYRISGIDIAAPEVVPTTYELSSYLEYRMHPDQAEAEGFTVGLSGTLGGGVNIGFDFCYFKTGPEEGLHIYFYLGANIGLEASAGASMYAADWHGDLDEMTGATYRGYFNSYSIGVGLVGLTYFWGNMDPEDKFLFLPKKDQVTWDGLAVSLAASEPKVGAKWCFSYYWELTDYRTKAPLEISVEKYKAAAISTGILPKEYSALKVEELSPEEFSTIKEGLDPDYIISPKKAFE